MTKTIFTVGILAIGLAGCGSAEPETPAQALQAIIHIYETRDFDSLIRTRYAEIAKAETEQQIQDLIDRFAKLFEDMDMLNQAIATYNSALQIVPELSEDDTVAVFNLDNGFIKLSRMPNGQWGFHL